MVDHLTKRQKDILREFVKYICEECYRHERKSGTLEPHKINPALGYTLRNIKMVCKYKGKIGRRYSCHDIFSSAQRIATGVEG